MKQFKFRHGINNRPKVSYKHTQVCSYYCDGAYTYYLMQSDVIHAFINPRAHTCRGLCSRSVCVCVCVSLSVGESNLSRLCKLAFLRFHLATTNGTIWCHIHGWELFGSNVSSQSGKPIASTWVHTYWRSVRSWAAQGQASFCSYSDI